MKRVAAIESKDDFFGLSSAPPSRAQERLAFAVSLALLVTFFSSLPAAFAHPAEPHRRLRCDRHNGDPQG
jgi:hypothetical protein